MSAGRPARSTSSDFRCPHDRNFKKAAATISICIFPVLPSCSFTHCSHHLLPIRQRVLLCLRCSIRWSIYRICRKTLLMILCPSAGSPCGSPIFLRKWQSIPAHTPGYDPGLSAEIHHLFDTQYGENYSLDELENTYSVSKYRICREFSKYYGASPVQYLNHKRIEEAKKLLLTTNDTIHEIGSKVGIHNTNHFINLFKRETGATPLAF